MRSDRPPVGPESQSLVGTTVGKRFEITGLVETEGPIRSYAASDREGGELVVVEVLPQATSRDVVAAVESELALAGLDHPGFARLLDAGQLPDGRPYLVRLHVHGVGLDRLIERGERLLPLTAARLVSVVASALDELHAYGAVHGLIEPARIVLTVDGPIVTGLGLGAVLGPSTELDSPFFAPERATDHGDHRSDVYSLGATVLAVLLGQTPRRTDLKDPPAALVGLDGVRPAVGDVVGHALARGPVHRYRTAGAFVSDLGRAAQGARVLGPWESQADGLSELLHAVPEATGRVIARLGRPTAEEAREAEEEWDPEGDDGDDSGVRRAPRGIQKVKQPTPRKKKKSAAQDSEGASTTPDPDVMRAEHWVKATRRYGKDVADVVTSPHAKKDEPGFLTVAIVGLIIVGLIIAIIQLAT